MKIYLFILWYMFVSRRKMQARISELESTAEQAKGKAAKLEKDKSRLTIEIKDVSMQLDEVSSIAMRTAMRHVFKYF